MTKDNVNHPSHYETGKFECIDVMLETQGIEAVKDFCLCNAFKYIYRTRNKNGIEDVKKAIWYLDKYVELSEPKDSGECPDRAWHGDYALHYCNKDGGSICDDVTKGPFKEDI